MKNFKNIFLASLLIGLMVVTQANAALRNPFGSSSGNTTGASSSTDNAIVRFDGTTGKIIQNSTITIGDTGAFASTIADVANVIGLTLIQNDVTNNPKGISVTNAGTGNSLYIDANGNTGTTASSSGAFFLDNTGNTGTGANFYTNGTTVGSTGVLFAKVDNASATGGVARFDNDGTGAALKINQNGNTGTTTGTSGGLVVNNAGTGFGAQFYTNSGASAGSLVYIEADNASYDQATLKIKNLGTSGAAANIRLDGVAPQIEFVETDQSTPAGKYEIEVQGDQFFVNSRNAADNSFENMLVANREASTGFTTWNFKGGVSTPIRTITTTGSVIGTDYTILCDATGGAVTMTLPAVANTTGMIIVMKKIDAGGNACTLDGNASETIDGATTKATSTQYGNFMIQSNGSAWYIIN